jgi:hypothetical protein
MKHIRNPDAANPIPIVTCNANSVPLLVEGNGRRVVYFDNSVIGVGVDVGELSRRSDRR